MKKRIIKIYNDFLQILYFAQPKHAKVRETPKNENNWKSQIKLKKAG